MVNTPQLPPKTPTLTFWKLLFEFRPKYCKLTTFPTFFWLRLRLRLRLRLALRANMTNPRQKRLLVMMRQCRDVWPVLIQWPKLSDLRPECRWQSTKLVVLQRVLPKLDAATWRKVIGECQACSSYIQPRKHFFAEKTVNIARLTLVRKISLNLVTLIKLPEDVYLVLRHPLP